MANSVVRLPVGYFPDPDKGRPLFNAKIYVGVIDLDPRIAINQVTVTGRQENGTEVVLAQPIRTNSGGVPVNAAGTSVVTLLVDGAYSMAVDDRNDNQKYYFANVLSGAPITFDSIGTYTDLIFNTVADLKTGTLSDGSVVVRSSGDKASTLGYTTANDGGGDEYIISASTGADNGGSRIDLTDGSGFQAQLIIKGRVNIKTFGAFGNGSTDDTATIQTAINYVNGIGGGVLYAPSGTYIVSQSTETDTWPTESGGTFSASDACLIMRANVYFLGESKITTNIKTADETKTIVFLADNSDNTIQSMSFEGNYTVPLQQGAGAGLFNVTSNLDDDVIGVTIKDVFVQKVGSYGIGLNQGYLVNCTVKDVETFFTGADGIDVKSRSSVVTEIDTNNSIVNFTGREFGQRVTGSVGVDIRGTWNIDGVFAREFGLTGVSPWAGFRLRPGTTNLNNVAVYTNATNIYVNPDTTVNTTGVSHGGSFCNVSNVTIQGAGQGIFYAGSTGNAESNNLSNVIVSGHTEEAFRSTVSGVDISISNFIAINSSGAARHFRIEGTGCTFNSGYGDDTATDDFSVAGNALDSFTRRGTNASYSDVIDINEVTSGRVGLTARGPETDIDIAITPKGAGLVRVGEQTALGAETLSGYITIKDSSGTTIKIAVIS